MNGGNRSFDDPGASGRNLILPSLFRLRGMIASLASAAATISAFGVVAACAAVSWAVLSRGALGLNTIWEMEASVYILIYAAFLSAAFTDRSGGQIGVRVLTDRLHGRMAVAQKIVLDVMTLSLFLLVTWSGWQMFVHSWETGWTSPTVWGPPLWIPHLAIPLGGALLIFSVIIDLAIRLCGGELADPQTEIVH